MTGSGLENGPRPTRKMVFLPSGRREFLNLALALARDCFVEPVMWIGDAKLDREAAGAFPTVSIVPQLFAIRPPESFPHETLGPASQAPQLIELYDSKEWGVFFPLICAEYDRFPERNTLRQLDRDAIVRGLGAILLKLFLERRPDFLLAAETPHNALGLATLAIARFMSIPALFFQPTSSVGPNLVPRTDFDTIFSTEAFSASLNRLDGDFADLSEMRADLARRLLTGYTESTEPPRFLLQQAQPQGFRPQSERFVKRQRWAALAGMVRGLVSGRQPDSLFLEGLFDSYRRRFLVAAKIISGRRIIHRKEQCAVFGLHYQPERTSIPEGPLETSQAQAVLRARAILPTDMHLYVKEHPSQVSGNRSGYLGRSPHFYSLLDRVPGITVLGADFPLVSVLEKVSLVFTLTGTVGVQAVLRGIPCVYFGNPWWQQMPGSWRFESSISVTEILLSDGPSVADIHDFLLHRLMSQSLPGFSSPSQEKSWSVAEGDLAQRVLLAEQQYFVLTVDAFLQDRGL